MIATRDCVSDKSKEEECMPRPKGSKNKPVLTIDGQITAAARVERKS